MAQDFATIMQPSTVVIVSGSDIGNIFVIAGFAAQEEVEQLAKTSRGWAAKVRARFQAQTASEIDL